MGLYVRYPFPGWHNVRDILTVPAISSDSYCIVLYIVQLYTGVYGSYGAIHIKYEYHLLGGQKTSIKQMIGIP